MSLFIYDPEHETNSNIFTNDARNGSAQVKRLNFDDLNEVAGKNLRWPSDLPLIFAPHFYNDYTN